VLHPSPRCPGVPPAPGQTPEGAAGTDAESAFGWRPPGDLGGPRARTEEAPR